MGQEDQEMGQADQEMGQEDKRWAKIVKRCQEGGSETCFICNRATVFVGLCLWGKLSSPSCLAAPAASVTRDQDVDQGAQSRPYY
jgi:alkanesulfonate monooxygenase SsuD/methylene tetrahydromethanopterin reductase-like flavin-dependent oxidoreductase (luciferase family)